MQINSALFVSEIRTLPSGQVDLVDVFDEISPESLPIILEHLSMYIDLAIEPDDAGKRHTLEMRFVDADNRPIQIPTPIRFTIPPGGEYRKTVKLDPTLFSVKFEHYGDCYMELRLNGAATLERRLYFGVLPPE